MCCVRAYDAHAQSLSAIDVLDEMGEAAQANFGDSESPIVQRILNNFMRQQQAMREQMERLRQLQG